MRCRQSDTTSPQLRSGLFFLGEAEVILSQGLRSAWAASSGVTDITLGFDGCAWHTHGNVLAVLSWPVARSSAKIAISRSHRLSPWYCASQPRSLVPSTCRCRRAAYSAALSV